VGGRAAAAAAAAAARRAAPGGAARGRTGATPQCSEGLAQCARRLRQERIMTAVSKFVLLMLLPHILPALGLRAVAPRGWNGFDSHLNHINETVLNATADALAHQLLPYGYNHFVMDAGWFSGTIHDDYGRPRPNSTMYPSTVVAGQRYTTLAPIVDAMRARGLELGIWCVLAATEQLRL
jgi:hypothetical protein